MKHTLTSPAIFVFSLFLWGLFPLSTHAASSPSVILHEVQIGDANSVNNEFIELYNRSDVSIDISHWKIQKKTASGTISSIATIDDCISLPSHTSFLWSHTTATSLAVLADKTTSASLASNNTFELLDGVGVLQDALLWDTTLYSGQSLQRNSATLSWDVNPTPSPTGHQSVCIQSEPVTPSTQQPKTPSTIRLNEILPHPTASEEFIELFNFGTDPVNLIGWSLKDASKTGNYTFTEDTLIPSNAYITLYRDTFSFALNDSNETISLFTPNALLVDTVFYAKSSPDASYGVSSAGWKWSSVVTPNELNQFDAFSSPKVSLPKNIYQDIPAEFGIRDADDATTKYRWDFGDQHSSRQSVVTHTYTKTGTYTVTLTTTAGANITTDTFIIDVRKLPKARAIITAINPNPEGVDTDSESITLKNTSTKKIHLKNWSIATGTRKKSMSNHIITDDIVLKPGKEILLTHADASFTLPNTEGFLEIRQPNKKAVDSAHYIQKTGVGEGDRYVKSGKVWTWKSLEQTNVPVDSLEDISETTDETISAPLSSSEDSSVSLTPTANDILQAIEGLSPDELSLLTQSLEEKLRLAKLMQAQALAHNTSEISTPPSVAGASDEATLPTDTSSSVTDSNPVIPQENTPISHTLLERINLSIQSLLRRF